jgi:hypothetical protein
VVSRTTSEQRTLDVEVVAAPAKGPRDRPTAVVGRQTGLSLCCQALGVSGTTARFTPPTEAADALLRLAGDDKLTRLAARLALIRVADLIDRGELADVVAGRETGYAAYQRLPFLDIAPTTHQLMHALLHALAANAGD